MADHTAAHHFRAWRAANPWAGMAVRAALGALAVLALSVLLPPRNGLRATVFLPFLTFGWAVYLFFAQRVFRYWPKARPLIVALGIVMLVATLERYW